MSKKIAYISRVWLTRAAGLRAVQAAAEREKKKWERYLLLHAHTSVVASRNQLVTVAFGLGDFVAVFAVVE